MTVEGSRHNVDTQSTSTFRASEKENYFDRSLFSDSTGERNLAKVTTLAPGGQAGLNKRDDAKKFLDDLGIGPSKKAVAGKFLDDLGIGPSPWRRGQENKGFFKTKTNLKKRGGGETSSSHASLKASEPKRVDSSTLVSFDDLLAGRRSWRDSELKSKVFMADDKYVTSKDENAIEVELVPVFSLSKMNDVFKCDNADDAHNCMNDPHILSKNDCERYQKACTVCKHILESRAWKFSQLFFKSRSIDDIVSSLTKTKYVDKPPRWFFSLIKVTIHILFDTRPEVPFGEKHHSNGPD